MSVHLAAAALPFVVFVLAIAKSGSVNMDKVISVNAEELKLRCDGTGSS